jgi:hypothetical protein
VFSFSQGVIHTYYTVALAPPIAALVGTGAALLWRYRHVFWARAAAAVAILGTAAWAAVLLDRTPDWYPWLRPLVLVAAVVAAVALLLAGPRRTTVSAAWKRPVGLLGIVAATIACLTGPLAYTLQTVTTSHTGSIPSAGPASTVSLGGAGGFGGGRGATTGDGGSTGGGGSRGLGGAPTGRGTPPNGVPSGAGGAPSGTKGGTVGGTLPRHSGVGAPTGGGGAGGTGGPGGTTVNVALVRALESGAGHYRWVAATDGSQNAADLELATGGDPVMAIGGFNNNGGNITLATFEQYVHQGLVHYYIAGGGAGGGPGGSQSSGAAITTWVEAHFHSETIGGETVYNLTSPVAG